MADRQGCAPKLRHELKHFINYIDYMALVSRARLIMTHDANADVDGRYSVRSLYFDNFEDKVVREKINGYRFREKFRLRYYNGDASLIKLEKKSRINGLCAKESVTISEQQCERLILGDTSVLKETEQPLCLELYAKMNYQCIRPRSIVAYEREAYNYPPGNVRVTFDADIRSGNNPLSFLSGGRKGLIPLKDTVLEVKYDEFLPQVIRDIVQLQDRKATAFSKYATARQTI